MHDLHVLVPMALKFPERIEDFKRYGLANIGSRKVLVSVLVTNETIPEVVSGWPPGVKVEVVNGEAPDYVANLYLFYTKLDPSAPRARWFMRLDDDTCTDVDGLVSNLDRFYDWELPFYLGDLVDFNQPKGGQEGQLYGQYNSMLGDMERFCGLLKTEIEAGIMSATALAKMLDNKQSRRLLEKRASLRGGYGDCVVSLAAAMAKVFPNHCPFVTHQPLIQDFSLFGGVRNHIHQVSRVNKGENFWGRASYEGFVLLTKAVIGEPNETESALVGRRFLLEGDNFMKIIDLKDGYIARVKLDNRTYSWYECDGELVILDGGNVIHRLSVNDSGRVSCKDHAVTEI